MPNYIYLAVSLDGFIARKDGNIDWLNEIPNPEGSDFGFSEFIKKIDAIVMGRKTLETVLTFGSWPYEVPVFVLTHTEIDVPEVLKGKVEFLSGEPEEIIGSLTEKNYDSLYIDGGETIRRFLAAELIDYLIITRIPLLLGEGIPLFTEMKVEQKFEHIKSEVILGSLVKSTYKKLK